MNRYPLVIVNGYPQEISDTDRLYNAGNITRGFNPPAPAVDGDLWFDTSNNLLKVYDGSGWISIVGSGGGSGGSTVVSPTAPTTPSNGSLWYDTLEGYLKVYLAGSAVWAPASHKFFVQNTEPASGFEQGDIWYSPLTGTFRMYVGGSTNAWTPMGSQLSVSDILAFG